MKYCRYCNELMKEIEVTDATNPYSDGRPIPAYKCDNSACKMKPYLLRYDKIEEGNRGCGGIIRVADYGEVFRTWHCPFCDNLVEILDSIYYIWNCPNCKHVASGGITFRFYPIQKIEGNQVTYDTDEEIKGLRHCGTCWDPYAEEGNDEDQEED